MEVFPVDLQLFVQALLYLTGLFCGLVTCIPTAYSANNVGGHCLLYSKFTWANKTSFSVKFGPPSACHYVVYMNVVACVFFALGLTCYYGYAVVKSKSDKTIGSQMWVMPFIMANALVAVLTFIASCIISIGYQSLCGSFLAGKTSGADITKCSDGQHEKWVKSWSPKGMQYSTENYYSLLTVAQTASWVCFLTWVVQIVLSIIRFIRNRRERSKDTFQGDVVTSDRAEIARQEPTA